MCLEGYKKYASVILSEISYNGLAECVLDGVSDMAARVALKDVKQEVVSESRTIFDVSDVLGKIVSPYMGKVVLVDVWGIGCAPCLSGMLNQKAFIKEYADSPLQVIYVAEEDSKEPGERWMRENEIAGEHVYLTKKAYAHLRADFNITGIPFGIIVNEEGDIVETGNPHFLIPKIIQLLDN